MSGYFPERTQIGEKKRKKNEGKKNMKNKQIEKKRKTNMFTSIHRYKYGHTKTALRQQKDLRKR